MDLKKGVCYGVIALGIVFAVLCGPLRAAQSPNPPRPLVFVPGTMGSKLCKRIGEIGEPPFGDLVWGDRASYTLSRLEALSLPSDARAETATLEPCGIISSVNVVPLLYTESYYAYAEQFFEGDLGYRDGENLFYFAYDWRFGTEDTAVQLRNFVEKVRASTGTKKVDIIAHSMGGLVAARYVMEYHGDKAVAKLVTVSTPFWGSAATFERLWSGVEGYPSQLLGVAEKMRNTILSFPSTFDLFPSYENCCWFIDNDYPFDPFDISKLAKLPWLVAAVPGDPYQAIEILKQRLLKGRVTSNIARDFFERYRAGNMPMLFLYAAASNFDTISRFYFDSADGSKVRSIDNLGDGVVLLASAAAALQPRPSQFADERHAVVFRSQAMRNWLENLLLEDRVLTSNKPALTVALPSRRVVEIQSMKSELSRNVLQPGDHMQIVFEVTANGPIDDAGFDSEAIFLGAEAAETNSALTFGAGPGTSRSVRRFTADLVAPATPGAYRVSLEFPGDGSKINIDEWFVVVEP